MTLNELIELCGLQDVELSKLHQFATLVEQKRDAEHFRKRNDQLWIEFEKVRLDVSSIVDRARQHSANYSRLNQRVKKLEERESE